MKNPDDLIPGTTLTRRDAHEIKLMLAAVRLANNIPLTPNLATEWQNSTVAEQEWAYLMIDKEDERERQ